MQQDNQWHDKIITEVEARQIRIEAETFYFRIWICCGEVEFETACV